jgi:membrane-bound lytic murein transglycosylase A
MNFKSLVILVLIATFLSGCTNSPEQPPLATTMPLQSEAESWYKLGKPLTIKTDNSIQLYPTDFKYLPGWNQDNHAQAYASFSHSCQSWLAQPDERIMSGIVPLGTLADWKQLCHKTVRSGEEKQFFEKWFQPYALAASGSFEGLFTGYYLPELHGSYKKSARYNVPIYGVPKDLLHRHGQLGRLEKGRFVPYHDRAAIKRGALAGKMEEILWVDNEVDAFFMEVQGSGRIIMNDGHIQGVGYAGKNGRPYYAIGKSLVDQGYIPREQISMQTIRNWIEQHPQEGKQLMQENQSVVFFKLTAAKALEGPIGSMNVPLTAGHSLAVDKNYLPLGIPLWLDAVHPEAAQPLRRLVMAQDTGGAIKGAIRGDLYWGQGSRAGELAGVMKSRGRFSLLIPKHISLE